MTLLKMLGFLKFQIRICINNKVIISIKNIILFINSIYKIAKRFFPFEFFFCKGGYSNFTIISKMGFNKIILL